MAYKNERWLDHTGLNLIRIVIGSYFMAISLDLISGLDPSALFSAYLPEHIARPAGTTLLFALSVAFMSGLFLRMMSLMLAIFVLSSSVFQNYIGPETTTVSSFWRDLALVCGILLSYCSLRRWEMRDAALLLRRHAHRVRRGKKLVRPRRVSVQASAARRRVEPPKYERALRPLIAPTGPLQQLENRQGRSDAGAAGDAMSGEDRPAIQMPAEYRDSPPVTPPPESFDDEVKNIFSNI